MKSIKAIRECANWLRYCRSIGWSADSLDELEAIWWRWHGDRGHLLDQPRIAADA